MIDKNSAIFVVQVKFINSNKIILMYIKYLLFIGINT